MSEIPDDIRETAKNISEQAWMTRHERDLMYHAIAQAILADRQRDQWRDISTAPWDEIILVYGEAAGEISGPRSGGVVFPAQFTEGTDYPGYHWLVPETDIAAMWIKATHWQPLPAAPKGEA